MKNDFDHAWWLRWCRRVAVPFALATVFALVLAGRVPGRTPGVDTLIIAILTTLLLVGSAPLAWRAGTHVSEWVLALLWGLLVIPAPLMVSAELWCQGSSVALGEHWIKPIYVTLLAPCQEEVAKAAVLMGWATGTETRKRAHRLVFLALWVGIGFAATETWLKAIIALEDPGFIVGQRMWGHLLHPLWVAMSAIGIAYGRPMFGVGTAVLLHAATNATSAQGIAPLLFPEPNFNVDMVMFLLIGLPMLTLVIGTVLHSVLSTPQVEERRWAQRKAAPSAPISTRRRSPTNQDGMY